MPKNNTKMTVLLLVVLLFASACAQSCANTQDLSLLLQAGKGSTIQETSRWPIHIPHQLPCPDWEPSTFPSATQSLRADSRLPHVLICLFSLQQSCAQQPVCKQPRPKCAGRKGLRQSGSAFTLYQRGLFLGQPSPELFDQFARWSLFWELHCWRIPVSELGCQHPQVRLLHPQLEPDHYYRFLRNADFGNQNLPFAASFPDPPSPRYQNRHWNSHCLSLDHDSLRDALLHLLLVGIWS